MTRLFAPGARGIDRRAFRSAFTLVEMLVVITIIGILMGMVLPAVGYVKELGRQTVCKNNLTQIAKALQLYHNDHGSYPYGRFFYASGGQTVADKGTMILLLLPYLDAQNFANSIDMRNSTMVVGTLNGLSAARISLPQLVCPSDPAHGLCPMYGNEGITVGVCNYVGSSGPKALASNSSCQCGEAADLNRYYANDSTYGLQPKNAARRAAGVSSGPFLSHNGPLEGYPDNLKLQATKDSMVRDGLSSTIFVGESRPACCRYLANGWTSVDNGTGYISSLPSINQDTCSDDSEAAENGCQCRCNDNYAVGFKSSHPGGAMFSFGDGSVQFIPESIDILVFQYLCAIDDHHPVERP